jgi:hypothetical protein
MADEKRTKREMFLYFYYRGYRYEFEGGKADCFLASTEMRSSKISVA